MVASQMLLAHAPSTIDSAGIQVDWTGTAWQRRHREPANKASGFEEIFGPCAGAALYRQSMLSEIGLFDETFFAYYEDVDLAWLALYICTSGTRFPHPLGHWRSGSNSQAVPDRTEQDMDTDQELSSAPLCGDLAIRPGF
jgi:hypothetical protein